MPGPASTDPEHQRWLDEIVSLTEAAVLRKVSIDTMRSLVRTGQLQKIQISVRKQGMTRREALGPLRRSR